MCVYNVPWYIMCVYNVPYINFFFRNLQVVPVETTDEEVSYPFCYFFFRGKRLVIYQMIDSRICHKLSFKKIALY